MMISGRTAKNPHAVVPWAALSKSPDDFFDPTNLPEGVELQEISRMKGGALNRCIRHWLECAEKGDVAFQFKTVQDSHRREGRGKGKGKGKGKRKQPASDDEDEEEDDRKDSHQQDAKGKKRRLETPTDDEEEDDEDDEEEDEDEDEDEEEEDEEKEEKEEEEEEEEEKETEDSADLVELTLRGPASEEDSGGSAASKEDLGGSSTVTEDGTAGEGDPARNSGGGETPPMWYDITIPPFRVSQIDTPIFQPSRCAQAAARPIGISSQLVQGA
jgi:hypothetical protein